ncbi:putative F-box associated interaction domain-containing protein [Helianthus anomalus]
MPPPPTRLIRFSYATNSQRYMAVWQSCNGLLLCNDRPDKLYVYNPIINQCKLLPLPHVWVPNRALKAIAIAFDSTISQHYKLVYARQDFTRSGRPVHVEMYSSETGVWRACERTFQLKSFVAFDRNVVYWRGAIHWLSRLHVYHFSLDDADFITLVVSRDCLLIARMLQPLQMNVYEMNKNGDYRSGWSVNYHVNLAPAPSSAAADVDFRVVSVVLGEKEEDSFLVLKMEVTGTGSMLLRHDFVLNTFHQLYDLTRIQLREM